MDVVADLAKRSYNTGIATPRPANTPMDFEDFGRRIDEELSRIRRYVETEIAPESERRGAEFLREVSAKLGELAGKLEARTARRNATGSDDTGGTPPQNSQS